MVGREGEPAAHGPADSTGFLVNNRAVEADVALAVFRPQLQNQIARSVNHRRGPGKLQTDLRWVSLRRKNEVVFELALGPVVDQVNPRIDIPRTGSCVGG